MAIYFLILHYYIFLREILNISVQIYLLISNIGQQKVKIIKQKVKKYNNDTY
jgi:tRNA A37 threonylcarbamoyladenosine dehydratase